MFDQTLKVKLQFIHHFEVEFIDTEILLRP